MHPEFCAASARDMLGWLAEGADPADLIIDCPHTSPVLCIAEPCACADDEQGDQQ